MTSLPAILSTLDQEITSLTEKLQPARSVFITEALHKLKAGGMMVPATIKAEDFIAEYSIALNGVPMHGLAVVVAKLKRGEYPNVSAEFMPLPAVLAAMSRAESKVIIDDLVRLRDRKNTLEEIAHKPDVSPEQRQQMIARVREMRVNFLRQHHDAKAAASTVFHQPMDADKAEYWSKIQALQDAPSIDAEQAAFRRKMAAEIAAAPQKATPAPDPEPVSDDVAW